MPRTTIVFYREEDGSAPLLDWLDGQTPKTQDKCRKMLERLHQEGHALRRPEADFLRDGIHELRIGLQGVNYRLLYFFHGQAAAVVSHGLTKERAVPSREIELAIKRRGRFLANPDKYTFKED